MEDKAEISNKDIYDLLKGVLKKTDEIKEEIKQEIRIVKSELFVEVEGIKRENEELKRENEVLKERLYDCERKLKKYSVMVYGVKEEKQEIGEIQHILDIINEKLEIDCRYTDLKDLYRVGKKTEGKNRPISVEFINYKLKTTVLANAKNLKGSNIFITNDYIPEDYSKRKILYEHLKKARANGQAAYIRNNTLIINGELFQYEELVKENSPNTNIGETSHVHAPKQVEEKIKQNINSNKNSEASTDRNNKPDAKTRNKSMDDDENHTKRTTRVKNNVKYFN